MEDLKDWESKFQECIYSKRLLRKILLLNSKQKTQVDIVAVKKAIYYARKYHGAQVRESGEPYYSHPIEVAYLIADYLFRTDILVVSILHDVIEDTDLSYEKLVHIFGIEIANQVNDLSRIKKDGQKPSSEEMLERLWSQEKYSLLMIKQFDRIHNLQTLSAKSEEKILRILKETIGNFILLAAYLEIPEAENNLVKMCVDISKKYGI
jgi:(p)ppGpp synthase/HD superfamily hydrolase